MHQVAGVTETMSFIRANIADKKSDNNMVVTLRGTPDEIQRALTVFARAFVHVQAFEMEPANSMGEFQQSALVLDREPQQECE